MERLCFKKEEGHVPLNWSKVASEFLQFTNHHIRIEVTGKRVNYDAGLGRFLWKSKSYTTWVKNNLEKLDNELLRGKFCLKCSCGAQKSVR